MNFIAFITGEMIEMVRVKLQIPEFPSDLLQDRHTTAPIDDLPARVDALIL